jgi:hypothetical protein
MAANVALSDTFDLWRTRSNQLLMYTQTAGGKDVLHVSNTTNSTSNTTGALTSNGGLGIQSSAVIGGSVLIHTNLNVNGDTSLSGHTDIGDAAADTLSILARVDTDTIPYTNGDKNFGNSTYRWGTVHVSGIVGSNSSASLLVPVGTSAERSGTTGAIRWNTTLSRFEGNTGTSFFPLAEPADQDGDTKIQTDNASDEDIIRFFTGNSSTQSTERVNIGTSGNVSIGTGATTGDAMLHVAGTANVTGTVNFTNRTNLKGNTHVTGGAWANVSVSDYVNFATESMTLDANTVILTGNLVVQGTRTYNDTTIMVSEDKTMVFGLASNVYSDSDASSGTITSQRNNSTETHGLSVSDKVFITNAGTSGITAEAVYVVATVPSTTTFTLTGFSGTGTLDFAKAHTDATASGGGIILPGATVHSILYNSTVGKWVASDGLKSNGAAHFTSTVDMDGDLDIDANIVHDGTVTHAGAFKTTAGGSAAANYILRSGDTAGTSTWVAFGIYNSAGTRLGP